MADTSNPALSRAARGAGARDLAIVGATELSGAVLLGWFLLADDWRLIVGMLVLMGAAFAVLQLRPAVEERIVAAFRRARRPALLLGAALVLVYPFAMQGSSYALHLLVIAQLYAVLALA
ncbi:MAG: hypothetical protein K8F31_03025, partial [Roseovarius sp.]|nr:hypothetical protein [Roseovarius sp.]